MRGFFTSVGGKGGAMIVRADNNKQQLAYVRNFKVRRTPDAMSHTVPPPPPLPPHLH
jgi:hypothetical protein